jgi:ParB-like chromosome segregation protein Spo0J
MTPEMIRVALVYPSHTGRTPDPERVKPLAASIKQIGLRTPITVRPAIRIRSGREAVAGRHRYEAVCSLGAEEIACVVTDDDDLHAQLWEIDENLMRAELSPSVPGQRPAALRDGDRFRGPPHGRSAHPRLHL